MSSSAGYASHALDVMDLIPAPGSAAARGLDPLVARGKLAPPSCEFEPVLPRATRGSSPRAAALPGAGIKSMTSRA